MSNIGKLPKWLKRPMPADEKFGKTAAILAESDLETICSNANCPNRGECWQRGTATVLILGNICTRNCKFCSVGSGKPQPIDKTEPVRVAQTAHRMGLKYLVITSVDRDDLADGGAGQFADCISETRKISPEMKFEILVPDFHNCQNRALDILSEVLPFVFGHNIETVPELYHIARSGGDYQRSLNLLKSAKKTLTSVVTKSSIMLGLGESDEQIERVLRDLRTVDCDRLTIGQYLRPSKNSLEVAEYIQPEKFDFWKQKALKFGFKWVMSSPFTRSSYFAEKENAV